MRITVKRPATKIASDILHSWAFCPSIFSEIVSSTRVATIIKTFELITTNKHDCRFVNYKITKNRKNCEVNFTEFLSPKVKKCRPNIQFILQIFFFFREIDLSTILAWAFFKRIFCESRPPTFCHTMICHSYGKFRTWCSGLIDFNDFCAFQFFTKFSTFSSSNP